MRRPLCLAAALLLLSLAVAPAAVQAQPVARAWDEPVAIGGDSVWESRSALAPLGLIVSVQQRESSSPLARIGVTETDGRTGAATDTPLWESCCVGYYPRLAVSPTGAVAAAYSDGEWLHIHVRAPGGAWREAGTVYEGQTDYSDGRPLLAYTPLGHLVVAWPRKDAGGGQRLWLTELAPGADEVTTPRPLDPVATPRVVQVGRDLAVSGDNVALAYLQGPSRTQDLTARVAFGRIGGGALDERHALPGIVTPWSWRAPQVAFDLTGAAAIAWHTVPAGFDQGAALGDLHLVTRRVDGTLRPAVDLGQTPTHGTLDLEVSDPGELLLGYEAAGNLTGGGGSWGYSAYGYEGVLGSTLLGLVGTPRLLAHHSASWPRLAMNRRGDAVVAYALCCERAGDATTGSVHAARRLPGGSFGDLQTVAEGALTPAGPGSVYGPMMGEVGLDEIGNAMVSWSGFGPAALGESAALDGPFLDLPLPGLPIGIELPPILPPLPELPQPPAPALPNLPIAVPVRVDASTLRRPPGATAAVPVAADPVGLSVRASAIRGVPRELTLTLRCDRACAVLATGRLVGRPLRAFDAKVRPGRSTRLAVKLSRAVRRDLDAKLRRDRRTTARLTITAMNSAGARTRRTLRISLKRR